MDPRRSQAWSLLDIGPRWVSRPRSPEALPADPAADWASMREQALRCERCALSQTRHQVVFGVGPAPAPWMIIGEAPGEQEDLRGEPFVGPAGQLLDQMLAAIGVVRERDVFIANVLKCRPPRNRDPAPEEIAQCSPWLLAQMAAVQPRVILAVGRFAAQTLLQTELPLGRLRGTVHPVPLQPRGRADTDAALASGHSDRSALREARLIATYHPSYLLRSPSEKAKAWQDLLLARQVFDDTSS